MAINAHKLQMIGDDLLGTCKSVDESLASHDLEFIDPVDVEDQLVDIDIERCQLCDWWCESYELEDGQCEDCRE